MNLQRLQYMYLHSIDEGMSGLTAFGKFVDGVSSGMSILGKVAVGAAPLLDVIAPGSSIAVGAVGKGFSAIGSAIDPTTKKPMIIGSIIAEKASKSVEELRAEEYARKVEGVFVPEWTTWSIARSGLRVNTQAIGLYTGVGAVTAAEQEMQKLVKARCATLKPSWEAALGTKVSIGTVGKRLFIVNAGKSQVPIGYTTPDGIWIAFQNEMSAAHLITATKAPAAAYQAEMAREAERIPVEYVAPQGGFPLWGWLAIAGGGLLLLTGGFGFMKRRKKATT